MSRPLQDKTARHEAIPADFNVAFDSACNLDGWIGYLLKEPQKQRVDLMRRLYEQDHFAAPSKTEKPTASGIPRILHQIWLGPQMPEKPRRQTKSWKQHHPDWEYRLWKDDDLNEFDSEVVDLISAIDCYAQKTDIARIAILQRYGGLYVDTDYDCFRACDILNQSFDFYTTMRGFPVLHMQFPDAFPSPIDVCNSAIGSIPNHPILNTFLERVDDRLHDQELIGKPSRLPFWGKINHMRVSMKTTYQLYQNVFSEFAGTTKFVDIALPPTFFNPIDTWWQTRFIRPAYYANLPGFLRGRHKFGKGYNLTQTYPYSFGHHESGASWL